MIWCREEIGAVGPPGPYYKPLNDVKALLEGIQEIIRAALYTLPVQFLPLNWYRLKSNLRTLSNIHSLCAMLRIFTLIASQCRVSRADKISYYHATRKSKLTVLEQAKMHLTSNTSWLAP